MQRNTRRGILAFVALSATLALSGCDAARPGAAALVGDQSIATTTLSGLVTRSLTTTCGEAFSTPSQRLLLERHRLTELISERLLTRYAHQLGLSVNDADAQAALDTTIEQMGTRDEVGVEMAKSEALADADLRDAYRRQALTMKIEDRLTESIHTSDADLRAFITQHPETYPEVAMRFVLVPDEKTAKSVQKQLEADPKSFDAILAQYASLKNEDSGQPVNDPKRAGHFGMIAAAQVEQSGFPTEPGSVFIAPSQSGPSAVFMVERKVGFDEAKTQIRRLALADQRQQALTKGFGDFLRSERVSVNPRFGTWDSKTFSVVARDDGGAVQLPKPTDETFSCPSASQ